MTIDELNALTTLTATDEVPVWDSEESGEPTKKITASNLAASVKSLGRLIGTGDLDSTPTQGSNKAVTSGGTYTAIQQSTANMLKTSDVVNNLTTDASNKPLSAAAGKLLNETRPVKRKKNVTLGAGNTASVSDIISDGEVGVLFVQQNTFTLQNLGYMALVRRVGTSYYVTAPTFPTSETLRPTLGTDGVLSVANTQYSGTYVCMFIVLS